MSVPFEIKRDADRALDAVRQLTPRNPIDFERRQQMQRTLVRFKILDQKGQVDNASEAILEINAIQDEALQLLTGAMHPPTNRLLSNEIAEEGHEYTTDGTFIIILGDGGDISIPYGTRFTITAPPSMNVFRISFADGVELQFFKKDFPLDGIPIQKE